MAFPSLSRRTFLRHAPLAAAAAAVPAVAEAKDSADFISPEQAAMKLGELMCAERPGLWRATIDREHGFVLICRDAGASTDRPAGVVLQP